jgi:hypothetical protein
MTGRVQKFRSMPDMSQSSSLERTERTKNSRICASVGDTLSDLGVPLLLCFVSTAVRRATLCFRIMPSCAHSRHPEMLGQTVFARRCLA